MKYDISYAGRGITAKTAAILCAALVSAAATAGEKTKVACIGDSITFGQNLADRESYPALLQKMLDGRFPGRYEVKNFGSPGRGVYLDSMRGSGKRGFRHTPEHRAALDWRPDIVICNLGINDCGEYILEYSGGRRRGMFAGDYVALLSDYTARGVRRMFIWTKLAPLAEGQKFHRSLEPFLMQADLEDVARKTGATGIDMQEPLREVMDETLAGDGIHPDARGAQIIAEATFAAMTGPQGSPRVELPPDIAGRCETWLCAGQSNMQKGWGEFARSPAGKRCAADEMMRLSKVDIRFWDFNDGSWTRLSPENALRKCAFGISFAIRRAEASARPVALLYVAAGGAPAESFLSEQTMCTATADGRAAYPHLAAIATNRRRLDRNGDFPCRWVAKEYPRRRGNMDEGHWWPVSIMYDNGIRRIRHIAPTGVLWYQGESNATTCTAPDEPTPAEYQAETLRAAVAELRAGRDVPFIMMGLPRMNRPWEQYRDMQRKVAAETGAVYVDTFAAGLGDPGEVHPGDKRPFADLAAKAAAEALGR